MKYNYKILSLIFISITFMLTAICYHSLLPSSYFNFGQKDKIMHYVVIRFIYPVNYSNTIHEQSTFLTLEGVDIKDLEIIEGDKKILTKNLSNTTKFATFLSLKTNYILKANNNIIKFKDAKIYINNSQVDVNIYILSNGIFKKHQYLDVSDLPIDSTITHVAY